ncbi:MAG: nucleotidyltransferase family protein, partial [Terriglobia bacterium]
AGVERIAVVLGHHAASIRAAVDLGDAQVVLNQEYRRGQTTSLQAGLRALEPMSPSAVLLCLVDHPAVSAETVRTLCRAFQEGHAPVVAPSHRGRHGHPVVISRELFQELLNLPPDEGANRVVGRYRDKAEWVEVDDPGVLLDIDNPADYAAFC